MTDARRWTRREYDALIGRGFFHEDEPVELVGGRLMISEPQGSEHAVGVSLASRALGRAFGPDWYVMVQLPIALDDESEPEPDVAVVHGQPRDYRRGHPTGAVLVVEVADSSLIFDRQDKGAMYARAGLRDYWIVNLVDRVLEVYRTPARAPEGPFEWSYQEIQRLGPQDSVAPLAMPGLLVRVTELLP